MTFIPSSGPHQVLICVTSLCTWDLVLNTHVLSTYYMPGRLLGFWTTAHSLCKPITPYPNVDVITISRQQKQFANRTALARTFLPSACIILSPNVSMVPFFNFFRSVQVPHSPWHLLYPPYYKITSHPLSYLLGFMLCSMYCFSSTHHQQTYKLLTCVFTACLFPLSAREAGILFCFPQLLQYLEQCRVGTP